MSAGIKASALNQHKGSLRRSAWAGKVSAWESQLQRLHLGGCHIQREIQAKVKTGSRYNAWG